MAGGIYEELIDECRAVGEGKIPADKDSEETKIKKLTEVIELNMSKMGDDELVAKYEELKMELNRAQKGIPRAVVMGSELYRAVASMAKEIESRGLEIGESRVNEVDEEERPAPEDVKIKPDVEEEAPEITKEYLGKTEDTHFYIVSTDEPLDLQILDQEGVMKYSAKDNNLEPTDIPTFLIQAIQDVEIDAIERSIFMKYILPRLLEEEESEEEEEFEEEGEEGKPKKSAPRKKKEIPPEEEELPRESKRVGEKKKAPLCSKCNKRHWPFKVCLSGKKDEGKIPADKDVEQTKINKLIEMIVRDDENNEFDVTLVDDGTIDTVIEINGREFRFSPEFASYWRDPEGGLAEEGLEELALDALSNLEEEEYNELVAKKAEIAAAPSEEETIESKVEETKLNDMISTILGVLRDKGDEASFEELREYLKDLNPDDYNDLVQAVELGNKDEIADIMKSVGFMESKMNEAGWFERLLKGLKSDKKFVKLVKEHGANSDKVHQYVSTNYLGGSTKQTVDDLVKWASSKITDEAKVNEGLESHVDTVLEAAGIIKGEDYGWHNGLEVSDEKKALSIISVLAKSGEFGPVYYENGKINFTPMQGIYSESKIIEKGVKDMTDAELEKILDHLEKVTRVGFDVSGRVKEIKDELSSRSTEETNEDYRQVRPGEYEVTFYDGTAKTLSAESTVDAMEKAKAESEEKRVLNVKLIKQTDKEADVQEEAKVDEQTSDFYCPKCGYEFTVHGEEEAKCPDCGYVIEESKINEVDEKKPGKEATESGTNESLDEKKHTNRLNNLLGL